MPTIDDDEEKTSPETPDALQAYRTVSGAYRIPAAELDRVFKALVEAQIRVLQERVAVLEAEVAALRATSHRPVARLEVVERTGSDPRVEP